MKFRKVSLWILLAGLLCATGACGVRKCDGNRGIKVPMGTM